MKLLQGLIKYWIVLLNCSLLPSMVHSDSLALGYGSLGYPLPEVGSYHLPVLGDAADGQVLNTSASSKTLFDIFEKKYNLLSFVYTNCNDVSGCPLTTHVFSQLKSAMRNDPVLADNLQLLSLSFDPERDSPKVMKHYGENFKYAGDAGEWKFLTTNSESDLDPILKSYSQDIQRGLSINGEDTGDISHILRVFLIDPDKQIRNIYSVGFLHADLITNDIKTLLQQASMTRVDNRSGQAFGTDSKLSNPGDYRQGYEEQTFVSNSRSLSKRKGRSAKLLQNAINPPLGLPKLPAKVLASITAEKIQLGRKLFFDRRLSLNDTFSCAMCHIPEQGFASNELSMAVGIEGRSVRRNSPTIYNTAYATILFHDGREFTLEQQVWGPLLSKNEMGNPSMGYVINKLNRIPGYKKMFKSSFDDEINILNVGEALASYQRALVSADSNFDRWRYAGQQNALSKSATQGFRLFTGKAGCASCHTIENDYALFMDNGMHNTGVGYKESMGVKPEKTRIVLAPGVFIDVDRKTIESVGESRVADLGLYEITENPMDRWKYKTPSLRNIDLTAPYMHNGSIGTLKDVIAFYNQGGVENEVLDVAIRPLDLSPQDVNDLVEFLKSLTGSNVDSLVSDAFAAPVGDVSH